jgi:O-antigen/teichoic acid export membrane protein
VSNTPLRTLLVKNFGTRLATLPITTAAGLATIAITIRSIGAAGYGAVAVIATLLLLLLPLADLGRGAAVTDAYGRARARRDDAALSVLAVSFRLLLRLGAGLALAGVVLAVTGGWTAVLGRGAAPLDDLNVAMMLVSATIGLSLPFGLGAKVLAGVGRNATATGLAVTAPLTALAVTGAAAIADWPAIAFALSIPLGYLLQVGLQWAVAMRKIGLRTRDVLAAPKTPHAVEVVRGVARPMLAVTLGLPLALQSDRILLSHVAPDALPAYAIVAQLHAPLLSLLTTAGAALWPFFTQRRLESNVDAWRTWLAATAALGAVGALEGVALVLVGGLLIDFVGTPDVAPSVLLLATFALLLVAQGIQYVAGVYMTRPRELRLQAILVWIMVPLNLALSLFLAQKIGAPGPVGATIICLILIQWLPLVVAIRRQQAFPGKRGRRMRIRERGRRDRLSRVGVGGRRKPLPISPPPALRQGSPRSSGQAWEEEV